MPPARECVCCPCGRPSDWSDDESVEGRLTGYPIRRRRRAPPRTASVTGRWAKLANCPPCVTGTCGPRAEGSRGTPFESGGPASPSAAAPGARAQRSPRPGSCAAERPTAWRRRVHRHRLSRSLAYFALCWVASSLMPRPRSFLPSPGAQKRMKRERELPTARPCESQRTGAISRETRCRLGDWRCPDVQGRLGADHVRRSALRHLLVSARVARGPWPRDASHARHRAELWSGRLGAIRTSTSSSNVGTSTRCGSTGIARRKA
jgi:hypothetical protein